MADVLLQIKNVKKKYGSKEALAGVSFDIKKGEIVGLVGVNGAGKTTLSSIIATLHPPTDGDILFQGASIYKNISGYRAQLGFCQQMPNLNDMLTLKQNLLFAAQYYGIANAQAEQQLEYVVKKLGLQEYISMKSSELSGGYRQRFMIARSLMHNPRLLLLDEPTVGLDPHIRRQLWDVIKMLKESGVTVVFTTHYLDEAHYLSDRVCILDKGQVKVMDTPDNLIANFKQKNLEDVFIALMKNNDN